MFKACIIGAAGYTGGEVLRILINHPEIGMLVAQSESRQGQPIYLTHPDLFGRTPSHFTSEIPMNADVYFLCKGHGESTKILSDNSFSNQAVIIDLSTDFRHQANTSFGTRNFVYGLPETNRAKIKSAKSIANPGCFATAIQLALLPLAHHHPLQDEVHVHATTGSTGAGQTPTSATHFTRRANNLSTYKVMSHQHEKEICETLMKTGTGNFKLNFIPQRGSYTRGIFAVTHLKSEISFNDLISLYEDFYSSHPFTSLVPFEVEQKQVVNTNNCFIQVQKIDEQVVITSAIDNLIKGASGQAIQNMNLAMGFAEDSGLKLKASVY